MSRNMSESCQNASYTLKAGIQKLYETKDFSDVIFRVGNKDFEAHKLILAARCSELASIVMDRNAVKLNVVEEDSVTEIGFEILLRFIYTDTLGTDDKQSVVKAYLAATYYKQNKLKEKCTELIRSWSFSIDEVFELLNISLRLIDLKEKCLNFIRDNALRVINSPTFFKLSYEAMDCILDSDALKNVETKKRVMKIIEWGAKQQTNPNDYALVRDYFLKHKLLGKLKLEELKLNDFSQLFTVIYKGFLTSDEFVCFVTYDNGKNKEDLPEWCATI